MFVTCDANGIRGVLRVDDPRLQTGLGKDLSLQNQLAQFAYCMQQDCAQSMEQVMGPNIRTCLKLAAQSIHSKSWSAEQT